MINQFESDKKLHSILKSINANPFYYSDQEIISEIDNFLPSYTCDYAAQGYFSIISHICYFRPDLERPLMKIAIKPLYYYGISNPDHAISWVHGNVKKKKIFKKIQPYFTSKQGRFWIENRLNEKQHMIKTLIEEIDIEDNL